MVSTIRNVLRFPKELSEETFDSFPSRENLTSRLYSFIHSIHLKVVLAASWVLFLRFYWNKKIDLHWLH